MKSVTPVLAAFAEPVSRKSGGQKYNDATDLTFHMGLSINILEAMGQDYRTQFEDNANAGFELALMDG